MPERLIALLLAATLGLFMFSPFSALAQSRPLFQPPPPAATAPPVESSWWTQAAQAVRETQARLQRDLAATLRAVRTERSATAALALMLLSFAYGVVHAAGPGHGKVVLSSYLVASRSAMRRGIILASAAAGVQALSAIALVGLLAIILGATQRATAAAVPWLDAASYAAIVLLGLWMLVGALRGSHHHHHHHPGPGSAHDDGAAGHHDHHHGHPDAAHTHHDPAPASRLQTVMLVFSMGIRPCSGAVLVLLFALGQGVFLLGVASAAVMAVGTAITTSVLAVLTVAARHTALRLAQRKSGRTGEWVARGLAVLGALAIVFFGALLFFSAWGAPSPV